MISICNKHHYIIPIRTIKPIPCNNAGFSEAPNEQTGQKDKNVVKEKEQKRGKYKARSPRYPCISLREAVKNARDLYEKDGKAFVAKEVAVRVWGYNKIHGRSLTVLAAMAQYGLLRYQKGSVGISDDAFTIIEAPNNSPEKTAALERCAKSPTIFDELNQNYPDRLPSDETLNWTLKQRGFTDEGAKTTIECLRDTNSFVQEQLGKTEGNEVKEVKKVIEEYKPKTPPQTTTIPQRTDGSTESATYSVPLHDGKIASVSIVGGKPTQEDLELLKSILEAFKLGLPKKNTQENKEATSSS